METKQKTEYFTLRVTKEDYAKLKAYENDEKAMENFISEFITREIEWLKSELDTMEDSTIRYKAMLINIKSGFSKAQDEYVAQIEEIFLKADEKVNEIKKSVTSKLKSINDELSVLSQNSKEIHKSLNEISNNTYKLENFIDVIERFSKLTNEQQEIIKLILNK